MSPLTKANLDDPITRHTHQDFTRLSVQLTVGQALDWLREHPPPGRIIYFYVVDDQERLQGVVPTRRLVLARPEQLIADIMVTRVIALPDTATVLEACEFFIQHRLLGLPVVNATGRLVGAVDVELYTEEISQLEGGNAREDLFQLIGVRLAQKQRASPVLAFRHRFPWLGCNIAAGILCAFLCGVYQQQLDKVVALAFFIPVVLNLAESVSSQSVSLTLQGLHGERPSWRSLFTQLRREFATGLMLGTGSGLAVALVCLIWLGHGWVALCLLGGIAGGVAGAAVMGVAMPIGLRLVRLEPRVAAGPIALAGADVLTLLIYLNLARWLLP